MSTSEISIESQRTLKFGNGLGGAIGEILYPAHAEMLLRMIGSRGQDLDRRRFGGREVNRPICGKQASMTYTVNPRDPRERIDIAGIESQSALKKSPRCCKILQGPPLVEPGQALEK